MKTSHSNQDYIKALYHFFSSVTTQLLHNFTIKIHKVISKNIVDKNIENAQKSTFYRHLLRNIGKHKIQ